jgi:hypothetical protein
MMMTMVMMITTIGGVIGHLILAVMAILDRGAWTCMSPQWGALPQ